METNSVESEINRIVLDTLKQQGDIMVAALQRRLKRHITGVSAASEQSFSIKIVQVESGVYRLDLSFFEHLRFSEIWKTKFDGLPNVDAIANWLMEKNVPLKDSKGRTLPRTTENAKSVAYGIAKHKAGQPYKKKVRRWYAMGVFKGAYAIFYTLLDAMTEEQIAHFKKKAEN